MSQIVLQRLTASRAEVASTKTSVKPCRLVLISLATVSEVSELSSNVLYSPNLILSPRLALNSGLVEIVRDLVEVASSKSTSTHLEHVQGLRAVFQSDLNLQNLVSVPDPRLRTCGWECWCSSKNWLTRQSTAYVLACVPKLINGGLRVIADVVDRRTEAGKNHMVNGSWM